MPSLRGGTSALFTGSLVETCSGVGALAAVVDGAETLFFFGGGLNLCIAVVLARCPPVHW